MKRRGNKEGSITQKKINNILYYRYRAPYPDTHEIYARTRSELQTKIETYNASTTKNTINKKTTLINYMDMWLDGHESKIKSNTYQGYKHLINGMLRNYKGYPLATVQLHNLSSSKLNKYLESLAKDYAPSSIQKMWVLLSKCLSDGIKKKEIDESVLVDVAIPHLSKITKKTKKVAFLTQEQVDILTSELTRKHPNNLPVYGVNASVLIFLIYSGLRVGEATALTWENVADDFSSILVTETYTDTGISSPKTNSSNRKIPMPTQGIEILKKMAETNPNRKTTDYVFLTSKKGMINRNNIRRTLNNALSRIDLNTDGIITTHSLRHTYGSILYKKDPSKIKVISELMGHSSIRVTMDIYISVDDKEKSDAVKKAFG